MATEFPPPLKPGDKIGVIAPAGRSRDKHLKDGIEWLKKQGYRVIVGQHVYERWGYFAGTREQRLSDLMRFIQDDEIRLVIASRGGFGTIEHLRHLDYEYIASHPKFYMGFSDLTVLLNAIALKSNLVTYHGPMVESAFGKHREPATLQNFRATIQGKSGNIILDIDAGKKAYQCQILHHGLAKGLLVGGCLTLMCNLIGTEFMPDLKGNIFFFEDIREEPYSIHRMLTHLAMAANLREISGLIVGRLYRCEPEHPERSLTMLQVIEDVFAGLDIPVIMEAPFGHGKVNLCLPVGARVIMDTRKGSLRLAT